jgi:hypothetical protein
MLDVLLGLIGDAAVEALVRADFECSHMTDAQKDALARAVWKVIKENEVALLAQKWEA